MQENIIDYRTVPDVPGTFGLDYRQLIQPLPAAIYTCDAQGGVTFYNQAAVGLWGREPKLGEDLWCGSWRIYDPDGSPLPLEHCPMAVALKEGRLMREKEIIIERPDGTRSCVLPYIELIRDEAGKVVGAVNMLVDITERKRGEEALREKDHFIRRITEVTPVVLDVFDLATSRHTYFSQHVVNLYGYTWPEFEEIQDPLALLVHPEDMPRVRENAERLKNGADDEINEFDCRVKRRDGQWRWVSSRSLPFARNEHGEVQQVVTATIDITERRQAEDSLRLAHAELERRVEERTAELAEANRRLEEQVAKLTQVEVALKSSESQSREAQRIAHLGNWERDLATNQIRASDEFCRIFFGFIPQDRQHAYETVFSLIHPEDQNPVLEVTKRALSDQKPFNVEYRIVRPDSSTRTISVSGEVITDQEGKAIKVRGIAQDITERKRVDDDFRKQKEVLQKIFDYIPIMVTFYDAEGKLKLANQEWERTQGWSLREIEEQKADILAELYPDALYRCTVLKTVAEADGHWRDFTSTTRDGKKIDVSWAVVRLSDQTTVCIGKNITERKRTEAERNQLMRRLITAQEDERRYISRELHDNMGQYLAALILGLESLGAVSQLPLRAHDELVYLKDVTKQFEQAVHRFTLDLRPTALDDLGLQVALAASVDDWARRCQYTVSADFHCSGFDGRQQRLLPEIEAALYRVVQEALTNVLRHAEASNVSVILERQPDDVRLIVEDDGKGFDVDALMRVPVANRRLGLTGMRERVELVGGTLEVDSGAGTTIVVNIPLAQPEL